MKVLVLGAGFGGLEITTSATFATSPLQTSSHERVAEVL